MPRPTLNTAQSSHWLYLVGTSILITNYQKWPLSASQHQEVNCLPMLVCKNDNIHDV